MNEKRRFMRRGSSETLARQRMTPLHMRVLDALADYRLSFHELCGEIDWPVGIEDKDIAEIFQTLIEAGYMTGGGMYEATGLRPPRTIDDEWQA